MWLMQQETDWKGMLYIKPWNTQLMGNMNRRQHKRIYKVFFFDLLFEKKTKNIGNGRPGGTGSGKTTFTNKALRDLILSW